MGKELGPYNPRGKRKYFTDVVMSLELCGRAERLRSFKTGIPKPKSSFYRIIEKFESKHVNVFEILCTLSGSQQRCISCFFT